MADEARMVFEFVDRSGGAAPAAPGQGGQPGSSAPQHDERFDDAAGRGQENNDRARPQKPPASVPAIEPASPSRVPGQPAPLTQQPGKETSLPKSLADTAGAAKSLADTVRGGIPLNPLEAIQKAGGAFAAGERLTQGLTDVFGRLRGGAASAVPALDPRSAATEAASIAAQSAKLAEKAETATAAVVGELHDRPMPQLPTFTAEDLAKTPEAPPVIPGLAATLAANAARTSGAAAPVGGVGAAAVGGLSVTALGGGLAVGALLAASGPMAVAGAVSAADRHAQSARERLQNLSPDVAAAEARARITQLQADLRTAQTIGPEIARGIEARAALSAEMQALNDRLSRPFLRSSSAAREVAAGVLGRLNEAIPQDSLYDLVTEIYTFRPVLEKIAALLERPSDKPSSMIDWFEKQPFETPAGWHGVNNESNPVTLNGLPPVPGFNF